MMIHGCGHYSRMPLRICWTVSQLVETAVQAWPQARFEVASIRPSPPGMTPMDARNNFHGIALKLRR